MVTTLLIQAFGTLLLAGEAETWLGKSDFEVRPFNSGSLPVPVLEEWAKVEDEECIFEFDVSPFAEDVSM